MTITRQQRRQEEREAVKGKQESTPLQHYKIHLGERPPTLPKLPTNSKEMRLHLSGKHTHLFRNPLTRAEKKQWDKFWKLKGKGFTKSGTKRQSKF